MTAQKVGCVGVTFSWMLYLALVLTTKCVTLEIFYVQPGKLNSADGGRRSNESDGGAADNDHAMRVGNDINGKG